MFTKTHCLSIALFILLASCKTDYSEGYSIKDFRKELRPYLTTIVAKGGLGYGLYNTQLSKILTDKEVKQLGTSEHPVLRAWAFGCMHMRPTFNYQEELINHLDDTAVVGHNHGEFGVKYEMISDIILENAEWKNRIERDKVIDKVVMKHNYLQSAYTILPRIEPREKYYPFIKDMVKRRRTYDEDNNYEQGFEDIENALYALAKFKRKDDVKLIKSVLLSNYSSVTDLSFALMKNFPDSSYIDVLEQYFQHKYYYNYPHERIFDLAPPFASAVATYENERSAAMFDSMLNGSRSFHAPLNNRWVRNNLLYEIWSHPCKAYSKLRNQITSEVRRNGIDKEDHKAFFWIDRLLDSSDTNIRWLQ